MNAAYSDMKAYLQRVMKESDITVEKRSTLTRLMIKRNNSVIFSYQTFHDDHTLVCLAE